MQSGDFEFVNGYPTGDTAERLRDLQLFNRATEVYLTQLMPVSEMALRQGCAPSGCLNRRRWRWARKTANPPAQMIYPADAGIKPNLLSGSRQRWAPA